jgi:hypothetical protein
MRILPVVERELRAIARRPSAYWIRSGAALAAFVAMAYVALVGAVGLPTAGIGRSLFNLLSLAAFGYCVVAGIRGTSDALSHEKREGTLGLLFLTDLKGYDVVLGKLLSGSINSVYGVLAVAPALALAFMVGGTSVLQFVMMIVLLLNTLFFSLAVGIFVSTFSQQERPAMGATIGIIFIMMVMPYAFAIAHTFGILEMWEVLEPGFLLASPLFAYGVIKDSTLLLIYFEEVWLSLAFAHLFAWLCLIVASATIVQRAHVDAPRGKFLTWFTNLRQTWAYGKAERRRAICRGLLDRNAFAWLAGRDRLKGRYPWIFLWLLALVWSIGRWKASEITGEWPFALFSIWFIHFFFKVWVASEVGARFIDDRRSGALELLLTTPLSLRQFANGEGLALFRQFGAPIALVIAMNVFFAWTAQSVTAFLIGSQSPILYFGAGIVHLIFDLYAIHWVAIWRSLHLRGTNRTIVQTILLVVILPVGIWFVMWQISWLPLGGVVAGRSGEEILVRWTVLCVLYDLTLAAIARSAFYREFREAATKTFDKPAPFRWKIRRSATPGLESHAAKAPRLVFTRARKALVVFAILLVGLNIIVAVRRHRLQSEVEARIRVAMQSGLPFTQTQVAHWRAPVGPRESASSILRSATKMYVATSRPLALFNTVARWNSRDPLPPDLKGQIGVWNRSNEYLFLTLEEIRTRKPGGASFDERRLNNIMSEELVHVLQAKARVELEDDPRAAARTISLILHFARVLQGESIPGFVGTTKVLESAGDLMQRAAIQGNLTADNWREWKSILVQLDPMKMVRETLISERADGFQTFNMSVDELYQHFGQQFGDFPALFSFGWSIRRFFGQDKAEMIEYLDEMNKYIADSDQPFWEVRKKRGRFVWRPVSLASSTFIAPQILPAFDWLFEASTAMVAHQRILIAVCDIEIYRAERAKLPEDLNALGSAATDPFDGKPLRYIRRTNEEYSVYSVGVDMTDNGGLPNTGRAAGDLAFHCGASPERKRTIKYP